MPGMSGVELSRELLRRSPRLRVLLLSGYPGAETYRAIDRGMDYLAKPVTPKDLLGSHRSALAARARAGNC